MKKTIEITLLDEGCLLEAGVRCEAYRDFPHCLRELARYVLQHYSTQLVTDRDVFICLNQASKGLTNEKAK